MEITRVSFSLTNKTFKVLNSKCKFKNLKSQEVKYTKFKIMIAKITKKQKDL